MTQEFTEDDKDMPVVSAEGEEIGTISEIEGDTAYVSPAANLQDATRTELGWDSSDEGPYELRDEQIDRIEETEIRLVDYASDPRP